MAPSDVTTQVASSNSDAKPWSLAASSSSILPPFRKNSSGQPVQRKLSLSRKRPLPESVTSCDTEFDLEIKRARLSLHSPTVASEPCDFEIKPSDFNSLDDFSIGGPIMMNGHKSSDSRFGSSSGLLSSKTPKSPPVASLCNLGNTCFLNSVLYTLRFTPGFLHSLHHMVHDLGLTGNGSSGGKSGSNSKRNNGLTLHQSQTNGSTNSISDAETELVHDVIDQLHELFRTLSSSDESDSKEPLPPSNFLSAVGKLNPMFEGNQQQDAHEMLGYILNLLQEIKIPASAALPPLPDANDENKNGNIPDKSETSSDKKAKKKSGKSTFLSSSNSNLLANVNPLANGNATSQNGTILKPKIVEAPAVASSLPNFVKENFVGKSVMGTRCLECETSTYRSETFTNIDIPLTFDDDEETLSVKDLFLREIMASETLRENNKYWCAECSRLNEAQRSVQYEVLPRIMVLQLKRFTATGNKNYMSKINDYIPTPLTMNCFCTTCLHPGSKEPKEQPQHHYSLYAVIMHLGATLASGHYIAYVRASDATLEYSNCSRNSNTVERKYKKGILKYFSRGSDLGRSSIPSNNSNSSSVASVNGSSTANSGSEANTCRSINCCGIRTLGQLSVTPEVSNTSLPPIISGSSIIQHHNQFANKDLSTDLMVMMANGSGNITNGGSTILPNQKNGSTGSGSFSSSGSGSTETEDVWLECDDDSISVITRKQFEEELSSKQNATTPYLLFYQRM